MLDKKVDIKAIRMGDESLEEVFVVAPVIELSFNPNQLFDNKYVNQQGNNMK
jgi:hypothetical protein